MGCRLTYMTGLSCCPTCDTRKVRTVTDFLAKWLKLTTAGMTCRYHFADAAVSNIVPGDKKNPCRLEVTETFTRQRLLNRLTGL